MTENLKPCPCCNVDAAIIEITDEDDENVGAKFIQCTKVGCGMTTPMVFPCMEGAEEKLLEIWNTRHSETVEDVTDDVLSKWEAYAFSEVNCADIAKDELRRCLSAIRSALQQPDKTVGISIEAVCLEECEKDKAYLLGVLKGVRDALQNISVTAQQASQCRPEQFCQYAYEVAQEQLTALNKLIER